MIQPRVVLTVLCLALLTGSVVVPAQAGDTRAIERELAQNNTPPKKG